MIISASRRTDIPCHYPEWFYNRIQERTVLVRNPMNPRRVMKVNLSPEVVDCIVFWTKNPLPFIGGLGRLKNYRFYFQFTVNPYGEDIEPDVPPKNDIVIPAFQKLSGMIGAEKVIWRYDPILLNDHYTVDYHINYFEMIAKRLNGYTEKCTVSFIDLYRSITQRIKALNLHAVTDDDKYILIKSLSAIAAQYGMKMDTCAESIDLSDLNISSARCVDNSLIERICGYSIKSAKDKNQRTECGCVESIDIGAYGTCTSGCVYCYANHSEKIVEKNRRAYDPLSPLLCGALTCEDIMTERKVKSLRDCRIGCFD